MPRCVSHPILSCNTAGLVAEVSASLKLFGGLKKLCQPLIKAVAAQGLQLCAAVAPTAKGAWLLAQSTPPGTVINGTAMSKHQISLIARFPSCRIAGIGPAPP